MITLKKALIIKGKWAWGKKEVLFPHEDSVISMLPKKAHGYTVTKKIYVTQGGWLGPAVGGILG